MSVIVPAFTMPQLATFLVIIAKANQRRPHLMLSLLLCPNPLYPISHFSTIARATTASNNSGATQMDLDNHDEQDLKARRGIFLFS